jgi:hypothetical protein
MEHTNNYNIQAKGAGRNSKITVQWKLLSDAMKNLEVQFERLQIDTEQARFEVLHHRGYIPVKNLLEELGSNTYHLHAASAKKLEDLENDLKSHEISRQDYVEQLQAEASYIDDFASRQKDPSVQMIFKTLSAFVYYGLANQSEYFNIEDIGQFVKNALKRYRDISIFLSENTKVCKRELINIIAIFRYLYLGQKYGLGLMNPPKEIFKEEGKNPLIVMTSARVKEGCISYSALRDKIRDGHSLILVFGTGWGLAEEAMVKADYLLPPIFGVTGYNHLAVRSAVAIILDRLLGRQLSPDKTWEE